IGVVAGWCLDDRESHHSQDEENGNRRGYAHIANPVSTATGFIIGNVHVMAGVPQVFQAMVENVLPTLRTGTPVLSLAIA
ncbi:hypothetical protein ACC685_38670, partial [Rhizobium ruizarguesonis]